MSKGSRWRLALLAAIVMGTLFVAALEPACSTSPTPAPAPLASAQIGPEGGWVETPDGVRVDVPPGALTRAVMITISDAPNNSVDVGASRAGRAVVLGPSALLFVKPVWVTLVVDPSLLSAGQSASDVTVATYPDISKLEVLEARAKDATHVVVATMHFSFYAPQITSACPAASADIFYDACGMGCKAGYHWSGHGAASIYCAEGWDAIATHCEVDTLPSYQTCNQLGCGPGFHVATSMLGTAPTDCSPSTNVFSCEVSKGASYDTCEGACDHGYQRTGNATDATRCVMQAPAGPINWSSHCTLDTSVPDLCSGDAGKDATTDASPDATSDAASGDASDASQDADDGG